MIRIKRTLLQEIVDYCKNKLPHEACGFISGSGAHHAELFIPLTNVSGAPSEWFHACPNDLVEAIYQTENNGHRIVGLVHSHPKSDAYPSSADLETEWHHIPSYWIVSFGGGVEPDVQVYRIQNKIVQKQPLCVD